VSKKTFIWFGIFVVVLAVGIPFWVFSTEGDADAGAQNVPSHLKEGQQLFEINCGTCHTLYSAGTDGNYGPNLDELLAPTGPVEPDAIKGLEGRVLNAVENGVDGGAPGRMPAGILNEQQAHEVAEFVAATAGSG
jgi:mono/diheme cytochrome c family protein